MEKIINGKLNWRYEFPFGFNFTTVWTIISEKLKDPYKLIWAQSKIIDHNFFKNDLDHTLQIFISNKNISIEEQNLLSNEVNKKVRFEGTGVEITFVNE